MVDQEAKAAPFLVTSTLSREERIELALRRLSRPVPSTKGMGPKDRANRLHSELESRIADAKEALRYDVGMSTEDPS